MKSITQITGFTPIVSGLIPELRERTRKTGSKSRSTLISGLVREYPCPYISKEMEYVKKDWEKKDIKHLFFATRKTKNEWFFELGTHILAEKGVDFHKVSKHVGKTKIDFNKLAIA